MDNGCVIRQRRGCDLNPGPSAPESNTLTTRLDNFSYEFAHCRFYFYCEKNALRQCKGLLFHSRLKNFLLCKSFPLQCSPSFLLLKYSLCGFPGLFTVVSIFSFFCFYTFLVVGSVRQIKLTYVGFRAHVKIASRIVSYRIVRRAVPVMARSVQGQDSPPTVVERSEMVTGPY